MDVRQKRSVSFKTHFFLFLFSFKFRTCTTPIVPGSKQLHCEYHLGGEGGEKGSTPKTYVNDSREYARSSILRVYVFSLFEEEGGWNNGGGGGEGEERKIEKSSGGKRSGCLIEIENGALSICTLLPSLSFSFSLFQSYCARSRVHSTSFCVSDRDLNNIFPRPAL